MWQILLCVDELKIFQHFAIKDAQLFNNEDYLQDRRYRDVGMGESVERYSELQQEYFTASTAQRRQIQATFCRTEASLTQVETKNRTL